MWRDLGRGCYIPSLPASAFQCHLSCLTSIDSCPTIQRWWLFRVLSPNCFLAPIVLWVICYLWSATSCCSAMVKWLVEGYSWVVPPLWLALVMMAGPKKVSLVWYWTSIVSFILVEDMVLAEADGLLLLSRLGEWWKQFCSRIQKVKFVNWNIHKFFWQIIELRIIH